MARNGFPSDTNPIPGLAHKFLALALPFLEKLNGKCSFSFHNNRSVSMIPFLLLQEVIRLIIGRVRQFKEPFTHPIMSIFQSTDLRSILHRSVKLPELALKSLWEDGAVARWLCGAEKAFYSLVSASPR
jgi:hypothetical protein